MTRPTPPPDDADAAGSQCGDGREQAAARVVREIQALMPWGNPRAGEIPRTGSHHLYFDKSKGWMLRVTIDMGRKRVGKRLKFRLGTRDAREAERVRVTVLGVLRKLGLRVVMRMQRTDTRKPR